MPIFQAHVGQGHQVEVPLVQRAYLQDRSSPDKMLALYGKVEEDRDGNLQIIRRSSRFSRTSTRRGRRRSRKKARLRSNRSHRSHLRIDWPGQADARWFRGRFDLAGEFEPDLPIQSGRVRAHLSSFPARSAVQVHWPMPEKASPTSNLATPAHIR